MVAESSVWTVKATRCSNPFEMQLASSAALVPHGSAATCTAPREGSWTAGSTDRVDAVAGAATAATVAVTAAMSAAGRMRDERVAVERVMVRSFFEGRA